MKRKAYYLASTPFFALILAAGVHAGGRSHDNCAECNRAVGRKVNTVIQPDSGEKIYVLQDDLKGNGLADNHHSVKCEK